MNLYPYNAPLILTDDIFADYGGDPEKATSKQRKLAYRMAEMTATEELNSFLLPTTVTGTYFYPFTNPIITEYAYINQVILTRFIDTEEKIYWTVSGTANIYVSLRDNEYGIIDVHSLIGTCNCHSASRAYPYQVQVVYNAGLPSGTSYQPDILMGLVTYADIILNEIVGYGNEGPGDVGIENFNNQGYAEVRRIKNTTFGSSPRAIFAQRMFQRLRRLRYVGI